MRKRASSTLGIPSSRSMILMGTGFRDMAFSLSYSTANLRMNADQAKPESQSQEPRAKSRILLSASNSSFQRGPHFPVMRAVVFFASAHAGHDLNINSGPQVVGERVLVLRVIAAEDADLLQLVECVDDLLKGAIDNGPRLVNPSLGFM